jgi:hypothetical protein
MQERLDRLAISTANVFSENHHLHYFTQEIPNNRVVCGATACIL